MSIQGKIPGAFIRDKDSQAYKLDRLVEARCARLRTELDKAKAHNSRVLEAALKANKKLHLERDSSQYYFDTVCRQRDALQKKLDERNTEAPWKALTDERDRYKKAIVDIGFFHFTVSGMKKVALDALWNRKKKETKKS